MSAVCWEMACRRPGLMREACGLRVRRTQHLNIQVFSRHGHREDMEGRGQQRGLWGGPRVRPQPP